MSKIDAVKKASYETRKKIYSGGLKGKALKRARNKFNKLEREIRAFKKRSTSESGIPLITIKAKRKAKIAKKAPKHQFVQEQGFIPGFLKMMNMVKIEEMVAQKLFNEIKAQLEGLTVREVELQKVADELNAKMPTINVAKVSRSFDKRKKAGGQ